MRSRAATRPSRPRSRLGKSPRKESSIIGILRFDAGSYGVEVGEFDSGRFALPNRHGEVPMQSYVTGNRLRADHPDPIASGSDAREGSVAIEIRIRMCDEVAFLGQSESAGVQELALLALE